MDIKEAKRLQETLDSKDPLSMECTCPVRESHRWLISEHDRLTAECERLKGEVERLTTEKKSLGVSAQLYIDRNEMLVPAARRYERLRVLGCAPGMSPQLGQGTVLRFQSLDGYLEADLELVPDRGDLGKSVESPLTTARSEGFAAGMRRALSWALEIMDWADRSYSSYESSWDDAESRIKEAVSDPALLSEIGKEGGVIWSRSSER